MATNGLTIEFFKQLSDMATTMKEKNINFVDFIQQASSIVQDLDVNQSGKLVLTLQTMSIDCDVLMAYSRTLKISCSPETVMDSLEGAEPPPTPKRQTIAKCVPSVASNRTLPQTPAAASGVRVLSRETENDHEIALQLQADEEESEQQRLQQIKADVKFSSTLSPKAEVFSPRNFRPVSQASMDSTSSIARYTSYSSAVLTGDKESELKRSSTIGPNSNPASPGAKRYRGKVVNCKVYENKNTLYYIQHSSGEEIAYMAKHGVKLIVKSMVEYELGTNYDEKRGGTPHLCRKC